MAEYKVPQDVEADDKLLGPFSFRQFVYLLIAAGLLASAFGLFQIFPLLAIIPIFPALLFIALALPLKKDQPMETYLAAIVSYHLKPRKRLWTPGQRESVIHITAPKIKEESRTRNITGEEATHRLSFLADIVDTGGYAIKGANTNPMRDDLIAEANSAVDMFETSHFDKLEATIARDENERHAEVIKEMRQAINEVESFQGAAVAMKRGEAKVGESKVNEAKVEEVKSEEKSENVENFVKPSIMELANNSDFTVATIAKEANRINRKEEGEVFISLH